MNKMEYAQAIANGIEGAEVKEVEKANGVILTGIMVKTGNVAEPVIYIDGLYKSEMSIEDAIEKVKQMANTAEKMEININDMEVYDNIKGKIVARLYNEKTSA